MKKISLFCTVLSFILITGCVTGTRNIELSTPDHPDKKSASGKIYIASISDNRRFEAKPSSPSTPSVKGDLSATSKETLATLIGRQRNGYGKAMGDVALPAGRTVMDETRNLIAEGLTSRGYTVTDDKNARNSIRVSIDEFWAWFSPGMWAVSFDAKVKTTLDIKTPKGSKKLAVNGYGKNKGQVASNENWKLAFDRAFTDFLNQLDMALSKAGL